MNELLNQFDYAVCQEQDDRLYGDGGLRQSDDLRSLIPYNNRIVLITNGFFIPGQADVLRRNPVYARSARISQHPALVVRALSQDDHAGPGLRAALPEVVQVSRLSITCTSSILLPSEGSGANWSFEYFAPYSPIPNGIIAIKYWPIDSYQQLFDNDATEAVHRGRIPPERYSVFSRARPRGAMAEAGNRYRPRAMHHPVAGQGSQI